MRFGHAAVEQLSVSSWRLCDLAVKNIIPGSFKIPFYNLTVLSLFQSSFCVSGREAKGKQHAITDIII
jgi:hypothetical protein